MVGVPTLLFVSQIRIPLPEVLWDNMLHYNTKSVSAHKNFIFVDECAAINIQISNALFFQCQWKCYQNFDPLTFTPFCLGDNGIQLNSYL
jgi:hypothetical protein